MTVHRLQGLSVDQAVLDLGVASAAETVYVSLSRVQSIGGVFVKSFDAAMVSVYTMVCIFYCKLRSIEHLVRDCVLRHDSNGSCFSVRIDYDQ